MRVDNRSPIFTAAPAVTLKVVMPVRLGLTIAAGVFLGLLAMRVASRIFSYLEDQELLPGLAICSVIGALLSLVVWQRQPILGWLGRHKKAVTACFFSVLVACSALTIIGVSIERRAAEENARVWEAQRQAQAARVAENQRRYDEFMKSHPGSKETFDDFAFDLAFPKQDQTTPVFFDQSKALPTK